MPKSINSIPTESIARQPRGIFLLNGKQIDFIRLEINTTTYFLADTFSATLPLSGQPAGIDEEYFASTPGMLIEIYLGFPPNPNAYTKEDLDRIIVAQVDEVDITLGSNVVTLTGRDLTAKFIDNKTTQKYPNLTASQIIEKLAKKEGLSAKVTQTSVPAGVYYGNDHASVTAETPEWDLMTYLAQQENFIVYVDGTTVYFRPQPTEKDEPYLLQYQKPQLSQGYPVFNGVRIKINRALTVARDIIVIVRSWNSKSKKAFDVRVKATPNKKVALSSAAQPIGDSQVFTQVIPGLTKEQALQKAQQILRQKSQHERNLTVELPGDNLLKKVSVIKLAGTNTTFDQVYFTSSINRVFSTSEGYKMIVNAKNHSPNSQVVF